MTRAQAHVILFLNGALGEVARSLSEDQLAALRTLLDPQQQVLLMEILSTVQPAQDPILLSGKRAAWASLTETAKAAFDDSSREIAR